MDAAEMLGSTSAWIDGLIETPPEVGGLRNPSAKPLVEISPRIGLIESFSNVIAFDSGEGLVTFDASHQIFAPSAVEHLRAWSDAPLRSCVYTHGHFDHVTGAQAFVDDNEARGHGPIEFIAHKAVNDRLDRYVLTNGYNGYINMRQFRLPEPYWPSDFIRPDRTYEADMVLELGDIHFDLHHARGETDDHTRAFETSTRTLVVGDLFIWQFPNAGNPQKVQRFAWDWAVALRLMADLDAELLVPAHGPAISGSERISRVLITTAEALESLHSQTLALMNAGARLDEVVAGVKLPAELAELPWLRPTYDEPEFVVRNLWRLYGGWYDGNPANLKPARDSELAGELAALAGGAEVLSRRAEALSSEGQHRLACHLAEMAALAEPTNPRIHAARQAVYAARIPAETSFMATGIYRSAALASEQAVSGLNT